MGILIALPNDMADRYDNDLLCRLCSNTHAKISLQDALASSVMTTFLAQAHGKVIAALMHGARYSVEDLETLTDDSKAYLVGIVCDVAMFGLLGRRPGTHMAEIQAMQKTVDDSLAMLSSGKDVLNLTRQVESGLLEHVAFNPQLQTISRQLRTDGLRGHLFAQD